MWLLLLQSLQCPFYIFCGWAFGSAGPDRLGDVGFSGGFFVIFRGLTQDFFELLVEIRKIVVSGFISNLCNCKIRVCQQFAGILHAYLIQTLENTFFRVLLEISAKGSWILIDMSSDLFKRDFSLEVFHQININFR